jgi:thiol-disulfide isomerase/thioredoxin
MGRIRQIALGCGLGAVLALSVAASGCGASGEGEGGRHPNYARALAGAPAPLAALYRQAGDLLEGGTDAYEATLARLRGHPVVVNVWASWCGPCRFEFPTLQRLSARYGKRVAFLGINYEDSDAAARTFLGEDPVPYPSYSDPHGEIAGSFGAGPGIPDTAYYGPDGKLCYLKIGQYADGGDFEADVRRYALQGRCEGG